MTDTEEWREALPHRAGDSSLGAVSARLATRTTPAVVRDVVDDLGRGLLAQLWGEPTGRDWLGECGGPLGAALVLAEVDAAASALRSHVAGARASLLADLVEDHSLVELAELIGVSRQALHKTLRNRGL
ncbi:hypothetical protein ACFQ46_16475 [Kineococcus sp. GCM10028916]|uniref:hypothetical protein n=1 Tax=Kineococcus sp. GCM10028916 TaxID=3273394 RepID=UPI003632249F